MRAGRLVLALLLLAPPALGQASLPEATLVVFAEDPGPVFVPGTNVPVNIIVRYSPGQTGRPTPAPTAEEPENTEPTNVTFSVIQQPLWVTNVTFEPSYVLIDMTFTLQGTTETSYGRNVTAILAIAPDAPAQEKAPFVVQAVASANGNIPELTTQSAQDFNIRATTFGLLNVTAEPRIVMPGGRWQTVPFLVRNDGNSDIVAKLNVTVRPENSQVEFLDTIEIKRGETKPVDVRMRLPWTNAEFGLLTLEATPIVDGEEAASASADVDVHGESAMPGPSSLLVVLLAALLARRAAR